LRSAVIAVAAALLALAPPVVNASAWYRCAHDGVVRAACCCPPRARHHGAAPPSGRDTALRVACCCKVTQVAARESSARDVPPPADALPALAPVAAPALPRREAPIPIASFGHVRGSRGPPELLFARNCSWLL